MAAGSADAYITMIPKSDGDSTPLGQRPLRAFPMVQRLCVSVRLSHVHAWFYSCVPDMVLSTGKGFQCGRLVCYNFGHQ